LEIRIEKGLERRTVKKIGKNDMKRVGEKEGVMKLPTESMILPDEVVRWPQEVVRLTVVACTVEA
jgi:hypothetical protein